MPFFNFNYITDPPADEFVDEVTQLNENWDQLESRLSWAQGIGTIPPADLEKGIEGRIAGRFAVWNGAAFINPATINPAWTAWASLTPLAPYVVRAGFPFKWRSNPLLRKVQLTGNLINTVAASPFPKGVWNMLCSAGIASGFQPVNGMMMQHNSTSSITSVVAGADVIAHRVRVTPNGASPVRIEGHWMGADAGGNYVVLDGVEWYY